tara:strand:+ start:3382 stop:4713 length:1332 start_codon:yes stop_codon:yes gene_type:complete
MINYLQNIFGIDKKISIFLYSKIFSYLAYPFTLFLLIKHLSPEQQGYYYTFYTLLTFSIFLELGLGIILTNMASHEFSKLSWSPNNTLQGDKDSLDRAKSLVKKTILWHLILIALFIVLAIPIGMLFFSEISEKLFFSWVLVVLAFSPGLILSPLLSILQGFQKIKEVQTVIFLQTFLSIIMFWIGLSLGFGVDCLAIQFFTQHIISTTFIFLRYNDLIISSLTSYNSALSWRKEILPLQIKTGVASAVGYLSLNFMIPFVMKFFGPETAGKLGMSIRISEIVSIVCLAWTNTRVPQMGKLISRKDKNEFLNLFKFTLRSICLTGFLLLSGIFIIFIVLDQIALNQFLNRVLSINLILMLLIGYYMFAISNYLSMTIRSFKAEKMIFPNIIAVLIYLNSIILSYIHNDYRFLILAFLIVNSLVLLPFAIKNIKKTINLYNWSD